jgi:ABC-type amino acid transport substrate-binding protein
MVGSSQECVNHSNRSSTLKKCSSGVPSEDSLDIRRSYSALMMPTALVLALLALFACSSGAAPSQACVNDGRTLNVGFYPFFSPISYTADEDPNSAGFLTHLGYESDLLSAMQAMDDTGLSFKRHPIPEWDSIWLSPSNPEFDMAGGGITILESRTTDANGEKVVAFTSGHIKFRQSLLVRAEDANRLATYDRLTSEVQVGALAGTTGEHRLLEIVGYVDYEGTLVLGARVETPDGTLTADGSANYVITSAGESPQLKGRRRIDPPTGDLPQIVYLGNIGGESELLDALRNGDIDAIARGEVGNHGASYQSSSLVVSALDDTEEHGGFALAVEDDELRACIDGQLDWLTNNRALGYSQWLADPKVFMKRAEEWNSR